MFSQFVMITRDMTGIIIEDIKVKRYHAEFQLLVSKAYYETKKCKNCNVKMKYNMFMKEIVLLEHELVIRKCNTITVRVNNPYLLNKTCRTD